ncbi:MAG: shikimate kinase [Thermodesulfobacteriota bacterium]
MAKAENIVLTGFMGTGKTTVGRSLSKKTGLRFLDADELIENKAAMPVVDIFSLKGEPYFRSLEKEVIKEVTETMTGVIFSTGGGAVIDPENRERLRQWGAVICLHAKAEIIAKRVGNGDERPLLSGDVLKRTAKIKEILKQREEVYKDCHLMIDTTHKDVKAVVDEVEGFLKGRVVKS